MRKAIIIKYEKEFLAWCKGDSVLLGAPTSMHDKTLIWREVRDFNDWKPLDTVYVLNDSYSDYRKALAEGKSIEFYELVDEDEFDSTKDVYKWLEWRSATPSSSFTKTLKYRIKPEEPKFKVGNWVVNKESKQRIIKKVTSVYSDSVTVGDSTVGINVILIKDLELWKPQLGELVILKNKNDIISIIKYNGETNVYPFIGEITWLHKKD